MTVLKLLTLFRGDADAGEEEGPYQDEFLEFERVENKRSKRADLHAFLLLDELVPGEKRDIVACAQHDEIWLGVDTDKLAGVITEEQVRELIRCGVRFDASTDSLCMFA